jgi:preprotein translocase subunit SecA
MATVRVHAGAPQARYPERADAKQKPLDFAFTEFFARVSFGFERHAASLDQDLRSMARFSGLAGQSDEELSRAARALRGPLLRHGFQPELVCESFALVAETMMRRLGMRPYPVQLTGAYALLKGMFIEMQTGEGKTLTGAIAAATAALAGNCVHVITVNDYLAARDAEHLKPVYEALGLTVGVIQHGQDHAARRAAYSCDVTYVVNKEVAFDYLRDGLAPGARRTRAGRLVDRLGGTDADAMLLRGLRFAIVDEADSVLIDEARTPLIISGLDNDLSEVSIYQTALDYAGRLERASDFAISLTDRRVMLTPAGSERLRSLTAGLGGIWRARRAREELVVHALSALHLYRSDQQYVVVGGKVMIIDEYTGRIAEGRTWQHGLHQLIEVKEKCEITPRNRTATSVTYQRFFRRYLHLSGMSGTLAEVAAELRAVYGIPVARIPTHRPERRTSRGVRVFRTVDQKWAAVAASVSRLVAAGRPVLIGTRSIATSLLLSGLLRTAGVEHAVLNAHHDREEADIIARAGEPGRVTIATNMAGRGTDIKLGAGVPDLGGLHVILTEFHESARIDRQLIGRCGRQGDPGSYEVAASLEDELMAVFGGHLNRLSAAWSDRQGVLPASLARALRWYAQSRAQRLHRRVRMHTLRLQDSRDASLAFANPE